MMTAEDVTEFYTLCEHEGIKVWIDGGWCVDALLGKETRAHKDLDIAVDWKDAARLRDVLEAGGFRETEAESLWNFVMSDERGRSIDIHCFLLDEEGNVVEGIAYPKESLTGTGLINRLPVNCISPVYMVKFLAPWVGKHPDKYITAISALCEKFDLRLPKEYAEYIHTDAHEF